MKARNPWPVGVVVGLSLLLLILLVGGTVWAANRALPLPTRLAVIPLPNEAGAYAIAARSGGYAYVLDDQTDSIGVLDGPTLVTLIRLTAPDGSNRLPNDLAVHPDTGLLYVADILQGIYVISGTAIITTIRSPDLDRQFRSVTVHPKTGYVYAAGDVEDPTTGVSYGAVRVISGTTVLADITLGRGGIHAITPDPRNQRLYAGGTLFADRPESWLLSAIEGTSLVMTSTVGYDLTPMDSSVQIDGIIVNAQNNELILWESALVTYWDSVTGAVDRINIYKDYAPISGLGWDPTRQIVYLGIQDSPYALALRKGRDPQMLRIVAGSRAFVYDATRDYIYSADYNGPSMSVIRGTQVLTTALTGGRGPWDIGLDEARGYIYVSNADSHSITVFGYPAEAEPPAWWQRFLPFVQR